MSKENFKEVETIIGPSVKVEGDFNAEGNVIIEGQMIGNLKTQKGLRVGEGAKIKANISAENAWVGGEIVGNVYILDHLELSPNAIIKGDVETENLTVATGAKINGQIKMGAKQEKELSEE